MPIGQTLYYKYRSDVVTWNPKAKEQKGRN